MAWLEEVEDVPHRDQFNDGPQLVPRWNQAKGRISDDALYVGDRRSYEDWGNLEYHWLTRRCRGAAGKFVSKKSKPRHDAPSPKFVDCWKSHVDCNASNFTRGMDEGRIRAVHHRRSDKVVWAALENALSNEAVLPVLWKRCPESSNLFAYAFFLKTKNRRAAFNICSSKKTDSRQEGANDSTFRHVRRYARWRFPDGDFDSGSYVYQGATLRCRTFRGRHPVVGSWIIGDDAAGIGIREDKTVISNSGSHFLYFVN